MIRNINNSKYNAHTSPLLAKSQILAPNDLHTLTTIRAIKKAKLGQAPTRIQEIFRSTENYRPSRTPNNINIDYNNQNSITKNKMPKTWNSLEESYKDNSCTIKKLITELKKTFI